MLMNVGILPCRSRSVCIFTAALYFRNLAQGNSDRHRSMVLESKAYERLCEIDADWIAGVERSRNPDQNLGEVRHRLAPVVDVLVGARPAWSAPPFRARPMW